ncbi:MAG: GNAT family N-acetyltransferase [Dysgonamonadaceae bacterium]|jgi:ribosomal protein S18 acetylase RimI-like enzyme|nr:GNAT family N-acetyltransferase [Dysgonamonadaceae bacterium]
MLNEVVISRAKFEDLIDILNIQKEAFLSEAELYNCYDVEPLNQTLESIQYDFNDYLFLKAEYHDEIVGSVKIKNHGDYCYVGKLIVSPKFQNKGIGRKLMTELGKIFPDIKKYELFTGEKSIKNIKLYESLGYQITETCPDDKVIGLVIVKMIKEKI